MRLRLVVPTLAASTCALVGIAAGVLGATGSYEPGLDPERCAIHSVDTKGQGVTVATVLSNDVGRVWVKDFYDEDDGAHVKRYYACRNHRGRSVFLASVREANYEGDERHFISYLAIRPEGLAGATVAFSKVTCPNTTATTPCRSKLRVVRLDREGGDARAPITRRRATIDAPFLAEGGRLMYYAVARPTIQADCGKGCTIHRVSRKGVDKVIDSGTDIHLASQALAPNGDFFWRDGSEPRVYPPAVP